MSKTYKAVVENGAIHIETPDFADGTEVEIHVENRNAVQSENCFQVAATLHVQEFPQDFSLTHKEVATE